MQADIQIAMVAGEISHVNEGSIDEADLGLGELVRSWKSEEQMERKRRGKENGREERTGGKSVLQVDLVHLLDAKEELAVEMRRAVDEDLEGVEQLGALRRLQGRGGSGGGDLRL